MNEKIKTDADQHEEAFDEKFQNSTNPDAMKALYKWYESNEEHRGLLILQIDEEENLIEGMMLGRRTVLVEGLAFHFKKDPQMVDVINTAAVKSVEMAMREVCEILEKHCNK